MKNTLKILFIICLSTLLAFIEPPAKLKVTSSAFAQNGTIPIKYSCDGAEVSPPLSISYILSGAKSLAIIVHDPDAPKAGGVTHWVMWNLPVDGQIIEGFKGGMQGQNSDHKTGYKSICPPEGTHHYNFKAYALDKVLQLDRNGDKAALENAMKGHIVAQGELTGLYSRSK